MSINPLNSKEALAEAVKYSKQVESSDALDRAQKDHLKNERDEYGECLNKDVTHYLQTLLTMTEILKNQNKASNEKSQYCIQDWNRAMERGDASRLREIKNGIFHEYSNQLGRRYSSLKNVQDEKKLQQIESIVSTAKQNLNRRSRGTADNIRKSAESISTAVSQISPKSVSAITSSNFMLGNDFSLAGDCRVDP